MLVSMTHRLIEVVQLNLCHSKSASSTLVKTLSEMNRAIALIQDLWLVAGVINRDYSSPNTDKDKGMHPEERDGRMFHLQLSGDY